MDELIADAAASIERIELADTGHVGARRDALAARRSQLARHSG